MDANDTGTTGPVTEVRPGLFLVRDTCQVWVFRSGGPGSTAIAVDFGSGAVLDHLSAMGVTRLTHVLMTHHHRDQGQGLHRAAAAGVEIWVPPVEVDLFADVERFWAARRVHNDYQLLTDRFSLTRSVPVAGTVPEYRSRQFGRVTVRTLPTPGHTPGSVSYLIEHAGTLVACTGDLIHSPGRVWSLAATQWTYTGNEGPQMTMLSALVLAGERPDLMLPSHGEMIAEPIAALESLVDNLQDYVDARRPCGNADIRARLDDPYRRITEHLLHNTGSESASYVLLSRTGNALVIDFGYDLTTWYPLGGPRWSQRPLLASLPALRRHHGVDRVEVALPTHYHDDHCAGMNLLRDVEGTQVWIPENVAPIMARPMAYDLPCQWFEPIPADRVLPLERPFRWHEYEITCHDLPGHTRYQAGFSFEVDGVRVLATGDQQDTLGEPGVRRDLLNYQYRNQFRYTDYRRSAALYRRIAPGLMVTGHWGARPVGDALIERLTTEGERVIDMHHTLLPLDRLELPADGVLARLVPYEQQASPGDLVTWQVEVTNPHRAVSEAIVALRPPPGWSAVAPVRCQVPAGETRSVAVSATVPASAQTGRTVLTVDVSIGDLRLGEHAEALVELASHPGPTGSIAATANG